MAIVDDSEVSRHLLQCMLSRLGQTDVVEAKNCSEAISCVESMRANQNFDIVFLDLGLDPASTDHTMFLEEIKSGRLPCLVGVYVALTHYYVSMQPCHNCFYIRFIEVPCPSILLNISYLIC